MIRISVLPAGLAVLAGCVTPQGGGVAGVREITSAQAASCTYVMDMRAEPGVYGALAQQGLEYARASLLTMARDEGANAVLFQPISPGATVTEIRGTAYRC